MDEYEIYEIECKKIKKQNRKLFTGFRKYLGSKKLSKKTVDKHVANIDFYINTDFRASFNRHIDIRFSV